MPTKGKGFNANNEGSVYRRASDGRWVAVLSYRTETGVRKRRTSYHHSREEADAALAVKMGLSELPRGISWRHVYGAGWLAGIGFTMSLFISDLAFDNGELVDAAKLGILVASVISGVVGWTILSRASSPH
jgi:hypothetical protein